MDTNRAMIQPGLFQSQAHPYSEVLNLDGYLFWARFRFA